MSEGFKADIAWLKADLAKSEAKLEANHVARTSRFLSFACSHPSHTQVAALTSATCRPLPQCLT